MGRTPAWEGAYREFFVARKRSLMRTAYAVLGSWPAAEDAVQTAFTQLYVHWPRIQPGAIDTTPAGRSCTPASGWPGSGQETATERLPDQPVAGPEGGVERLDLLEALAGLSARDRAVIALQVPRRPAGRRGRARPRPAEGTVKSRTSRALDRLQAVLTPPQPTEREHP